LKQRLIETEETRSSKNMSWFAGKGRQAVAGVIVYGLLMACVAGAMIPSLAQFAA